LAETEHASVARVRGRFSTFGANPEVRHLTATARSAAEASEGGEQPLLVITSGRHRVDTALVAEALGCELSRADADFVREWSGFAIGGVSPVGWSRSGEPHQPVTIVDTALADYPQVWAAAGHTHVVLRTTFEELVAITGGRPMAVAAD
jgi:prolyl-tRNA editing enzyme YbaK/EbsC (Cys-tRNA(Pro) deacylase)